MRLSLVNNALLSVIVCYCALLYVALYWPVLGCIALKTAKLAKLAILANISAILANTAKAFPPLSLG